MHSYKTGKKKNMVQPTHLNNNELYLKSNWHSFHCKNASFIQIWFVIDLCTKLSIIYRVQLKL